MPSLTVEAAPARKLAADPSRHGTPLKLSPLALTLPIFLLTRLVIFFAATTSTDSQVYYQYGAAARTVSLDALYRNHDAEYPHLAVVFSAGVGWFADQLPAGAERLIATRRSLPSDAGLARFQVAFGIVLFGLDALLLLLVNHWSRRIDPGDARTRVWRLGVYVAGTAMLGPILYDRLDLVVGAIAAFAVIVFTSGRSMLAYILLTLGVGFKLVPVVLLPVFVLGSAIAAGGCFWRAMVRESAVAFIMLATLLVLALAYGGGERAFAFWNYHAARGLELGSAYSAPVLALAPETEIGYDFGGYILRGSATDAVARFSVVVAGALLVMMTLAVARAIRRAAPDDRGTVIATGCVLIWLSFILTNKVGSPQYLLWVAPLVPFLSLRTTRDRCWAVGFVCAGLLATLTYPYLWPAVHGAVIHDKADTWAGPTPLGFLLLSTRWLVIGILTGWLFLRVWRFGSRPAATCAEAVA